VQELVPGATALDTAHVCAFMEAEAKTCLSLEELEAIIQDGVELTCAVRTEEI